MTQLSSRNSTLLLLALADTAIALVSLWGAYELRQSLLPRLSSLWAGAVPLLPTFTVLLLGSLPMIVAALYMAGAYSLPRLGARFPILVSVAKAFVFASMLVLASAYALRDLAFSRAIVVSYLLLTFSAVLALRLVVCHVYAARQARGIGLQNTVIVGTGPAAVSIADAMRRKPYLGFRVSGFVDLPGERAANPALPTLGRIEDLPRMAEHMVIDTVVFAVGLEEAARFEHIIWRLEEVGLTVHLRGDAVGGVLSRTFIGEFEGTPMLTLRSTPADPITLALKRGIDILGSFGGLCFLSPVFLAVALAVRLSSPGPVFYRQDRVGLNGRRFKILKFRSMYVDAERRLAEVWQHNEMDGPVFKMANDPRTTPVGRSLRRYSLDELPQLWNVLVGEMSLVGPRPPIPDEVQGYQRWQRRRLSMKSGITCLWQVEGRNEIDFETWMKLDMEYIDNWSLALDMKILLKTIPVVLLARGAR